MPKMIKDFPEQINLLCSEGTRTKLIAIAYFRGEGGQYAAPARDFIFQGITNFIENLSDKDRRVFNEILENTKISRFE